MHLLFIEFFQNLKKYLCRILSWEILDVEKIRQQASSCLQEIYLKTGNGLWYVRILIAYFVFCLFRLSIKCSLDGAPDWTLSFEGLNRSFENPSTKKQIHQIPEFFLFLQGNLTSMASSRWFSSNAVFESFCAFSTCKSLIFLLFFGIFSINFSLTYFLWWFIRKLFLIFSNALKKLNQH